MSQVWFTGKSVLATSGIKLFMSQVWLTGKSQVWLTSISLTGKSVLGGIIHASGCFQYIVLFDLFMQYVYTIRSRNHNKKNAWNYATVDNVLSIFSPGILQERVKGDSCEVYYIFHIGIEYMYIDTENKGFFVSKYKCKEKWKLNDKMISPFFRASIGIPKDINWEQMR